MKTRLRTKNYSRTYWQKVPKVVKVVINYVIDGGDLVISIDKSKIKYPPEQIPLELTLMEYFMSAGTDEEDICWCRTVAAH